MALVICGSVRLAKDIELQTRQMLVLNEQSTSTFLGKIKKGILYRRLSFYGQIKQVNIKNERSRDVPIKN